MKKLGIFLFTAGIIVMLYAAFNFVREKRMGSEEDIKEQNLPFPWFPTVGGVLIATGIIAMVTGKKETKV
ncbi:MAG: hypothetical protein ACT4ON_00615 [Bacteroidota bacterium]